MGARRRRNRRPRRQKFLALRTVQEGEGDIDALVAEALRQAEEQKKAAQHEEQVKSAEQAASSQAEDVTELYFKDIPREVTAADVVEGLLIKLYLWKQIPLQEVTMHQDTEGRAPNSAVLRCDIHENKYNAHSSAYAVFRTSAQARTVLDASPIDVKGAICKVFRSKRGPVPGVVNGSRASVDPDSRTWKIGMIQAGEKVSQDEFRVFWSSSTFFDLAQNSQVSLNPLHGLLVVTIERPQRMMKARPLVRDDDRPFKEVAEFQWAECMMKIEIPFRAICGSITAERNQRTSDEYAVYFPISKAPYLFRAEAIAKKKNSWDYRPATSNEVKWIRTVDPTQNGAFSRARGLRISLELSDLDTFFDNLKQRYLATVSRNTLPVVSTEPEISAPRRNQILAIAKSRYQLSFEVRYMIDCVLSLGSLSLSTINSAFWEILAYEITDDQARLRVLNHMYYSLSGNDKFAQINDPVQILRDCINALHVPPSGLDESDSEDEMSESDESVRTEDTEDFEIEQFFRQLSLNEGEPEEEDEQDSMLIDFAGNGTTRRMLPSRQHTQIRRIVFTPTKTIAHTAEPDLLNRVLREFWDHEERFVRVSFCDEDGGSVAHAGSDDLYARVRAALKDGIHVAGEKFVFLAFSNSQLRDHAVWMYNEAPGEPPAPPTADLIRAWMGDFSSIRVPGKFAARQGQTFSSTVGTTTLDTVHEGELPDIVDRERIYTFSDGVGVMSYELAKFVSSKLRLDSRKQIPSAFQIRYGGAKGMLTVWDKALPRSRNTKVEVAIRPSMRKFESSHRTLEVVGIAKRLPLFLNRQIIMLLSAAGVSDEPFEKLQEKVLRRLDRAMKHDGTADALHLLYSSGHFQMESKIRSTGPMTNPADFFRSNLTCESCDYLYHIMYAYRRKLLKDLTDRARIPIDYDKGLCAIGVLDEIGVLRHDEVFCQFTDSRTGDTKLVSGRVTIGRSPCLHPGDIQQVYAVDRPHLRHLVDVIVFPQIGVRPLPSMLGGGDLDGDIFFLIFDETIAPDPDWRCEPMDSSAPRPLELEREVTSMDVADFFVQYIRNDRLGQIANAHLVHADKESYGVHSKKCLQLAILHSIAVDFAKSGVPAPYPRELQPRLEEGQYPDFMGKHPSVSYPSEKILGKLYRACLAVEKGKEKMKFVPSEKSKRVDDIIDKFPIDQHLQDEAQTLCAAYNADLLKLMHQFGVSSEGEIVSGHILTFTTRHSRLQGRRDHLNLVMRVNRETNELRAQFREEFFRGLGQQPKGEYNVYTIIKACAWYRACKRQAARDQMLNRPALISFPWVVADVLLPVIRNDLRKDQQVISDTR